MLNAVIVEGPDGAGKTTLIRHLGRVWGIGPQPRAASSTQGPNVDLVEYVENAEQRMAIPQRTLWDRHPVISENIYGPIIRGSSGLGTRIDWLRRRRGALMRNAFVVWCMPPLATIIHNIDESDMQMPGVDKNITALYAGYVNAVASWPMSTPAILATATLYDYTRGERELNRVVRMIDENVRGI